MKDINSLRYESAAGASLCLLRRIAQLASTPAEKVTVACACLFVTLLVRKTHLLYCYYYYYYIYIVMYSFGFVFLMNPRIGTPSLSIKRRQERATPG
jgi:hypothetical protein